MVPRSTRRDSKIDAVQNWMYAWSPAKHQLDAYVNRVQDCSGWVWSAVMTPEDKEDKDICTMDELCDVLEAVS